MIDFNSPTTGIPGGNLFFGLLGCVDLTGGDELPLDRFALCTLRGFSSQNGPDGQRRLVGFEIRRFELHLGKSNLQHDISGSPWSPSRELDSQIGGNRLTGALVPYVALVVGEEPFLHYPALSPESEQNQGH